MTKVIGPLLSLSAKGSVAKTLTYQKRPAGDAAYQLTKPGDKNPFTPSWKQRNQRGIIGLLTAHWQCMSQAERDQWDQDAKDVNFVGRGYHYWLKKAQTNLLQYHGLVGYWSFNKGSGCQALDLSGNNNHGTLKPTCPSNSPVWVDGQSKKFGKALKFDGDNDYILSDTSVLLSSTVTYEVWFKASKFKTYSAVVSNLKYSAPAFGFNVIPHATGEIRVVAGDGVVVYKFHDFAVSKLTTGVWYHMAVTHDGDKFQLFINGVYEGEWTFALAQADLKFFFGRFGMLLDDHYFDGFADEIRIYDRVLGTDEIKKHYQMFRRFK